MIFLMSTRNIYMWHCETHRCVGDESGCLIGSLERIAELEATKQTTHVRQLSEHQYQLFAVAERANALLETRRQWQRQGEYADFVPDQPMRMCLAQVEAVLDALDALQMNKKELNLEEDPHSWSSPPEPDLGERMK